MSRSNGIGCKGGTSATAGKKSVTFEVTLPDGRVETVRKFNIATDEAWSACYVSQSGEWRAGSFIRPSKAEVEQHISGAPGKMQVCQAKRIS